MELQNALGRVFGQLSVAIEQLSESTFNQPVESLNNSTIGQHTRHTIEFVTCLIDGYDSGTVNYDKRCHDKEIERSRILALDMIKRIEKFAKELPKNKDFTLEVNYDPMTNENEIVPSSYYRELVYNIEHAIHHMALIKVGLKEVAPDINVSDDFGVAVSTLKYQNSQQS